MKIKLTTFLFGLLLAVGWTSSALAQPATYKAEDMVGWKYTWDDANGNPQESDYVHLVTKQDHFGNTFQAYETEEVTNPYQIYGLLRAVYMNPDLPGPWQSAYDKNGNREDDIFYGGCDNGWNIPGTYTTSGTTYTLGSMTINFNNYSTQYPVFFEAIRVASGTKIIASWNCTTDGTTLPTGWSRSGNYNTETVGSTRLMYFTDNSGSITIPGSITAGYENVEVVVTAVHMYNNTYYSTINVGGYDSQSIQDWREYGWNFNTVAHKKYDSNTYKPREEGYTTFVVALKDTAYIPTEGGVGGSTGYNNPDSVINYIAKNIKFVKLLTDGLRIKDGDAPGTVFNCDGTYNKFFFLGKGKARQKAEEVQNRINAGTWPGYAGECVVFWPLFEEFSPTTGTLAGASTVVDFFDRMNEGQVYDVVHDCAGVIQNRHEFTLAGEDKTDDYPFTGLNFFVPDYRLKYWQGKDSVINSSGNGYDYVDVDGRNMNGMYTITNSNFRQLTAYYSNYAQYNPDFAPKVGIYKITLKATATQVADSHATDNQNFVVTLTWVSSLNEMSGTEVPQTYTIYLIDNETGEEVQLTATGVTNPTGRTTISYIVPQKAHSYTLKYIVMGTPDDSEHPDFIAWSNTDMVIIPGWDDFVGLKLDHHESDFKIRTAGQQDYNEANGPYDEKNYYRNFLAIVNPDSYNGLTVSKVAGENGQAPMNEFTLYRYTDDPNNATPIAKITFGTPTSTSVPYTVTYLNEQKKLETPKYDLDANHLNIPLTGVVRVKGNGDIVIWPSSYHVNFKSITVKDQNGTVRASWSISNGSLPSSWILSPGSEWEQWTNTSTNDYVGYVEGGGYIAIPGILANYPNATVEIVCYGDGSSVSTITVNDVTKTIDNNTAKTYKWGKVTSNDDPLSPYAAPKSDNTNNNTNN